MDEINATNIPPDEALGYSHSRDDQIVAPVMQEFSPRHVVSTDSPQNTFEVIGRGSTVTGSTINSTQAHTIINNHQYVQQSYVLPKEGLPETWNLPRRTAHFTGRQELLKNIEECFSHKEGASQRLVLTACHGLGGVGKTQLALHYAWENYQKYNGLCFFSAESKEGLIQCYIDLGNELNIFTPDQKNLLPEKRAGIVKNWLEDPKRAGWLLIYDNASKYDDISELLPTKGGKILVTSRHTVWPGETIPVDVFMLEEAREYVKKITGITNEPESVDELIKILGQLPLALAQACAYIKENGITIKEYLVLYQEAKRELLADGTLPPGDQHEPVMVTWNITLKKMQDESPDAVELMYVSAFFYHQNITEKLLEPFFGANTPTLLKLKCNKAKTTAKKYSMIKVDDEKKSYSMHSVVQEVIKTRLREDKKFENYLRKGIDFLLKGYPGENEDKHEHIQLKRELLLHLEEALKNRDIYFEEATAQIIAEDIAQLLGLLVFLGDTYSMLGYSLKSKELLERALILAEKYYGKENDQIAIILNNLGNVYGELGDAQKQKELLERALIIDEKHYGKDHVKVANTLTNLGNAYGALGEAQKSKEYLENALSIEEKHYGKEHVQVAILFMNLSNAYAVLGDVEKQKALLEQALPIIEAHYGKEHIQMASLSINLANVHGSLGNVQKQKELLEHALAIDEKHYGKEHIQVGTVLNNLGNAYRALGDLQKSRELFERALSIKEKHYGKNHYQVAVILNNLGNLYGVLGDMQKKKEYLLRALPALEAYYGKGHIQLATTLLKIGDAYGALGDIQKRTEYLARALAIFEKYYVKDHIQVADIVAGLGNAYGALGKVQEAELYLMRALSAFEKHYGKNHIRVGNILTSLGGVSRSLGDIQKSQEYLQCALPIVEQHYDKDHAQVGIILNNLGNVYGDLGDLKKSQICLERALSIKEKHYGKDHIEVAITFTNLGTTYGALGNAQKQRECLERAFSIFLKEIVARRCPLGLSLAENNQEKPTDARGYLIHGMLGKNAVRAPVQQQGNSQMNASVESGQVSASSKNSGSIDNSGLFKKC